jgi:RNA polymerase sigma-70 factor (ECF subfamily)
MKDNLSNIENQLLVMAAQDGDAEAMEKLVRRWQKKLWQYVFRLTSDDQVTWDITQQCWLAIIKGLKKLNDPASFKAWAYKIATNKSIDWLKNKGKSQRINLDLDLVEAYSCQEKDDLRVKELVRRLKNDSRAILSLYYFEQLSISEIGAILNIPQGTVKSRLFKAREELKKLWEKYFDN